MNKLLFILWILFSFQALAAKPLSLDSIGRGRLLHLNGQIELPKEHRLNKGAPSKVEVFEKLDGQWTLTEKMNLNEFLTVTETVRFQKPVHLKSDTSEIKISVNVYHCPENHKGLCVIDDFEGIIQRSSKKVTSEVALNIQGTDPKKY